MAGDWIKVEKSTPRKPEVLRLAAALQIHPDQAFGLCIRFWMWCDDHMAEPNADGVSEALVDVIVGHSGFAKALVDVDWLRVRSGSLEVPHFERHLSESSKKRALTAQRVARHERSANAKPNAKPNAKTNARSVSSALAEKRREEKILRDESLKNPSCSETAPPPSELDAGSEPPIMEFPCVGKGPAVWPLTESQASRWGELFPGVDVLAVCRKALAWCESNPQKRKTFGGMPRFLVNVWLSRTQNETPRALSPAAESRPVQQAGGSKWLPIGGEDAV